MSLAGGWSFVLPFVLLAGSLPVEWLFGRLFQSDAWGMFMAHAGKAPGGMTVPFPGQRRTGDFSFRRKGRIISTNPVMRV